MRIQPKTLMEKARVYWRLWRRSRTTVPSFCKKCGRQHRDFVAPDETWGVVRPHIKHGNVLCYDCFAEHYHRLTGKNAVWRIADD